MSPRGCGQVQPLSGGVNPRGDSVYLQCSRRHQEDAVRSLPAGFKGLGLLSPYQYRISNLEGMRAGNRVVCTVCSGYGFPDFVLHQLQGLQMGLWGRGSHKGRDIRVKKGYGWWRASIDDFKRGKSTWAGCVFLALYRASGRS